MARLDLTSPWLDKYVSISAKMLDKGSIFDKQLDSLKERFDEFGLTPEQLAELTAQLYMQVTLQYNKDAISATNSLMKQEAEDPIKDNQALLILRQKQGFDDNMLLKITEQKSSVASFAVNSNSDSAQSAITSMNETMGRAESRVQVLEDEVIPVIVDPTPTPANLGVDSGTSTTLTVSWSTVLNATSYELFLDGVSITTTGQSVQVIDSLSPSTKYAFNVRAFIDTVPSELSQTVVGETIA